ncbi:hypothetical protein L596_018057 [Steinernema carpocapsae]|uniref:Peptidase M13 C-terminal domain-containing protein n=1 Tax=Steinernema carpocapsae TaxID=34508 RepID=A0A4U5N3Y7_STECR|nr:hypothetical protein L596_018057 [Steinernema carpocapsae]
MYFSVRLLHALLALLASFPLLASTGTKFPTPSELKKAFNSSVSPCEDMNGHTCDETNPVILDFVNKVWSHGMAKNLVNLANLDDPVFKALLKEFERLGKCGFPDIGAAPEKDEEFGKYLGRLHATGGCTNGDCSQSIVVECDATRGQPHCELYTLKEARSPSVNYTSLEDKFVQGFIHGYLNALNVSDKDISRFTVENNTFPVSELKNLTNYEQAYLSKDIWNSVKDGAQLYQPVCSSEVCVEKHRKLLFNLSREHTFAPYFNVLLAKTMYENPNKTKISFIEDMDFLLEDVNEAIRKQVETSSNYNETFKSRVKEHLENMKMVNGFLPEFRNFTYLDDLLTNFQDHILKDLSPDSCNLKWIINRISAFRNRMVIMKEPLISPLMKDLPFEPTIFVSNAAYMNGTVHVFPGYLHPLQQEVPVGFKYGYVAWTIGHEMFHGLFPRQPDIIGIAKESHFKEAEKCYADYFGSKQFCLKDGLENTENRTCPDGNKKAEEGFSDIESARVVFSVLKKALRQEENRKKKRSTGERLLPHFDSPPVEEFFSDRSNSFDQEKWFYKAYALSLCQIDSDSFESFLIQEDPHPRSKIRINAIARQTKNFAKVFQCKKEDPNYTTEHLCSVYTVDEHFTDLEHSPAVVNTSNSLDDAPNASEIGDKLESPTEATISRVVLVFKGTEMKSSNKYKSALILVFSLVAFFV